MLSYTALMLIKEHNNNNNILYIVYQGAEFVFKAISYKEYLDMKKCVTVDKDLEDAICTVGVLYPKGYDFSSCPFAGLPEFAAESILKMSNVNDPEGVSKIIDIKKDEMKSFHNQCVNLVKAVFVEYRIDEILEWNWEHLLEYSARAEQILRMKGIDVTLNNSFELGTEESEVDEAEKEAAIVKELREYGLDPMIYFGDKFIDARNDKPDYPLIGGVHWQREDVLGAIRGQMERAAKGRS